MKVSQLSSFASFNCFSSCVGTVLAGAVRGRDLALNTRWQFFYLQSNRFDDDNRQVGEYPRPFDEHTFDRLRDVLGIDAVIRHGSLRHNLSDVTADIRDQGASIVQVDRYYLDRAAGSESPRHLLTTVLLTVVEPDGVRFHDPFGDDGTPTTGWIRTRNLSRARSGGRYGRTANAWRLILRPAAVRPAPDAGVAVSHLAAECDRFVSGRTTGKLDQGIRGLRRFARAVREEAPREGNVTWFERMRDWSRHLQFVQMQRKSFVAGLSELGRELPALQRETAGWIESVSRLTRRWQQLRMVMYLSCARRQAGMAADIARTLAGLADEEERVVTEMAGQLRRF